jgi:TonB family protein
MIRNTRSLIAAILIGGTVLTFIASPANAQSAPDQLLKDAYAQMNAGAEKNDEAAMAAGVESLRKFVQQAPDSHKMKKAVVATLAFLDKMRENEKNLAAEEAAWKAANPNRTFGSPSMVNGRPVKFIRPEYPPLPREANAHGIAAVQIEVGEDGKVVRVLAVNGHPLLQQPAAEAALKTQFTPTVINGTATKAHGTLKFTF